MLTMYFYYNNKLKQSCIICTCCNKLLVVSEVRFLLCFYCIYSGSQPCLGCCATRNVENQGT